MKQFKKIVGFLLCLAMVLSIVPASIFATTVKAATTTTDILEKINLTDTVIGGCSQNGASVSDIQDLIWYNKTAGHETWSKHKLVADGSASSASTFNCGGSERADWYLDLSGNTAGYTTVDQFTLYAGGSTSVPTIQVTFILEDGTEWEETFTTGWNSADDKLSYTLDETINATGMYVWQPQNTTACLGEIELYHYIQIESLETAKINGVDLSQYKIVYSASDLEYAKTAAEYIQKQILLKTGRSVDVVTDSTAESTYEILVGNTSRTYSKSISAPSETAMKFTFASNGTKIAMKADYFIIAGAAYYFVETYIGDTNFDVTVNTGVTTQNTITKPAKNFIMLIGDGMGVSQTEMFEYYDITDPSQYDPKYNMSDGEDIFYGYYFPYEGRSRTWNVLNEITDSGAGGTALATGYKTYNQHIGQNSTQIGTAQVYDEGAWQTVPVCQDVENLTELALRMGKSAAVMSTEETWGATPSAFSGHMYNRYEYNDIWADQDKLRNQGVIFVDHDRYLNQFTAAEWEDAKPYYKAALEQIAQDPDGFFMMYEEAYIDKECHNNRPDLSFMTMVRFNQAIAMFMEFAMYNPETLVVITADHETGGLAATSNGLECTEPNPNSSGFNHTLMEVPVFAYGAGADAFATNIVDPHDYYSQYNGWYHNTSIARTFGAMMGDENFGDPQFPILTSDYEPEPENPNAPKLSALSGLATPEFGYYTDNNTNGALTSYYNNSYIPANLVDGNHSNQTRSQYYTYAEVTSGAKVPAIVFDLGGEKDIAAVEVDTYKATYYGIDNFDIQVYNNGTWTTVKSVTGAFSGKTHGEACAAERYEFTATTGTKVRILVTKLSDMTSYGAEDVELATGSYIRLKEITIYEDLNAGAPDQPTTQPTTPPTTPPATEPVVGTMQKIDLTGTVVGVDSQNSATESDFTKFTWYSTINPGWKDITIPVNGNYDDEIHWGLDPHERGDIYLDLTRINASGVAASQLKLYHSKYRDVPSLVVILKLADGSFVEKTFTLNWKENVAAEPFVYTFDDTYTVTGVYLWENQSNEALRATFGEIEMFYKVGDEPATPPATEPTTPPATQPTTPPATEPVVGTGLKIVSPTKLSTVFGYYADGTGADESTFWDGNDGYCVTDGWFGRAGYSECTPSQGKVALVMTLSETKTLGGIEITGNGTSYDPVDFDVQAYVNGQWVTVYSQDTNAFTSSIRTVMCEFNQTVTTNKVRILVHEVSGGTSKDCRLQEVVLFETSDKAYANIDLTGKGSSTDANAANPVGNLVDNSKDSIFLGSNATFNLGTATKIDGFRLFNYRGNNPYPSNVTVEVQLTAGGAYTNIGTFATGWNSGYPLPIMDVEFGQTYEVYGIRFNFGAWAYINGLEVYQYVEAPAEPDTILVGASYSVHLIEPWALRTYVQFAKNTEDNLIPVAEFTNYGAYAILGNKFEGTTAEELMADPDAVQYTKADGNITVKDATTLTFDFYDGLFSYNLGENIYWVAYFETADGTHYTGVQVKSLTDVADELLGDTDVSESEKAVLESMQTLKDTVTELRGENADLGHTYAPGVANPGTLGDRNTGYLFGTSFKMKLIEPWGVRVRVLMREKSLPVDGEGNALYADYEGADDYGLIFFHDKTGKYNGTMTAAQLKAEADAKVYSKLNGNAAINAGGVTAVYDQDIFTYDLDTELYCLPYIVIDGAYYYPSTVSCWNLLTEINEFAADESLDPKETAVFDAMLAMYTNVQNHNG